MSTVRIPMTTVMRMNERCHRRMGSVGGARKAQNVSWARQTRFASRPTGKVSIETRLRDWWPCVDIIEQLTKTGD